MNKILLEEALRYAKKNVPAYIKIDKTFKDALKYHLVTYNKTEITEQSIRNWIEESYKY